MSYNNQFNNEERIQLIGLNEEESVAVNVEENNFVVNQIERHKPRIYWIDWLRVYASFLVVFQHSTYLNFSRTYGDHNWNVLFFYNCFTRHCVPFFVMISGLLFLSPKKVIPFSTLYKKYIYRIFISLLFWSPYYNIINEYVVNVRKIEYHFTFEEISRCFQRIITGANSGHLWYLYFCIGLYMTTPVYKVITEKRDFAWYFAGLSFSFIQAIPSTVRIINTYIINVYLINDVIGKMFLGLVGSSTTYYLLGYLLNTHEFRNKIWIKVSYAIGIIGQILTIILRFDSCRRNNKEVAHYSGKADINIAMIVIGTFMFFKYGLNDWINNIMNNNRFVNKLMIILSDCSFGIYLVHMTVYDTILRYVNLKPTTFDPVFWSPIYSTIVFFSTAIVVYLLRLIPFFKKVT